MGRTDITTLPDNTSVDNDYYSTGQIKRVSGSRTYTREYGYDAAGRQSTLTTNPGAAEQQITQWIYDPVTGRLQNKKIAGAITASYTYTNAGRVDTKTNARNIVTDYDYNTAGQVETITYSDGTTPNVAFTYRRSGDVHTCTHAGSTYTYDYGLPGEKEKCTVTGGILDGHRHRSRLRCPPPSQHPQRNWKRNRRQPNLELRTWFLSPRQWSAKVTTEPPTTTSPTQA